MTPPRREKAVLAHPRAKLNSHFARNGHKRALKAFKGERVVAAGKAAPWGNRGPFQRYQKGLVLALAVPPPPSLSYSLFLLYKYILMVVSSPKGAC